MFDAEMPSVANRRTITPEEHRHLKNDLYVARCKYAKLLHAIDEKGETRSRAQQLRTLERNMTELESELAHSDVVYFDDEVPMLDKTTQTTGISVQSAKRAFAFWTVVIRNVTSAR